MGRHMSALAAWPGLAPERSRVLGADGRYPASVRRTLCDYTGRTRAKPEQSDPSVPSPSGDGLSFVYQGRAGMEAGTLAGMAYETYTAWLDRQPCWPPVHEKRTGAGGLVSEMARRYRRS